MKVENIRLTFFIIIIAIGLFYYVSWVNSNDIKLIKQSIIYENCIKAEYDMTPSAYYYDNGEYPKCKNK